MLRNADYYLDDFAFYVSDFVFPQDETVGGKWTSHQYCFLSISKIATADRK